MYSLRNTFFMKSRATKNAKCSAQDNREALNKIMKKFNDLNKQCALGQPLSRAQMHSIKGRVKHCLDNGLTLPSWNIAYNDILNHQYTSDSSWTIVGLRRIPDNPEYREVLWENTYEPIRNLNIQDMDEESYITLYPSNEDKDNLRKEFQEFKKIDQ